ncbi:hypothetical protein QBC35DRAFT_509392 [Podospora australis]|uniref:Secreted protein n=1 Tax=Podospora australis TaxID=1536484 RepID=A0AAN6WJW5_9PEZI|nr:hypothetical protein QBC35DRAFT_509392 [Podospora australis]
MKPIPIWILMALSGSSFPASGAFPSFCCISKLNCITTSRPQCHAIGISRRSENTKLSRKIQEKVNSSTLELHMSSGNRTGFGRWNITVKLTSVIRNNDKKIRKVTSAQHRNQPTRSMFPT